MQSYIIIKITKMTWMISWVTVPDNHPGYIFLYNRKVMII